jgi:hypothetical protein
MPYKIYAVLFFFLRQNNIFLQFINITYDESRIIYTRKKH